MNRDITFITDSSNAFKTSIYSKHGEDVLLHFAFLYFESKLLYSRRGGSLELRTYVNSLYTAWVCQHEELPHNENGLFSFDPEKLRDNSYKMGYLKENYGSSEHLYGKMLEIIGASEGRTLAYFIKEQIKLAKRKAERVNGKFAQADVMIETPDYGMIFKTAQKDMPYRVGEALKYIEANGMKMPDAKTMQDDWNWTQCILPFRFSLDSVRKVNEDTKTIFSFRNVPDRKSFSCAEAGLAADILLKKDEKQLTAKYGEELVKKFIGEPANCFEEQMKINLNNILNELRVNLNNAIADAKRNCEQECRAFNQARLYQRDNEIKALMEKFEADTKEVMKKMNVNSSTE